MIFNIEESAVLENGPMSAYPLGVEGGYMHLYEMQTNWNALMQATGVSEARYFVEHGGDLLLEEEGAKNSFLGKVIQWFKDVIEKIKQIVRRFVATLRAHIGSNKKFIKKYSAKLAKLSGKTVDAKVHKKTMADLDAVDKKLTSSVAEECSKAASDLVRLSNPGAPVDPDAKAWSDSDANAMYSRALGKDCSSEADFHTTLKNACGIGGEKESAKCKVGDYFKNLTDAEQAIKSVTSQMNGKISAISGYIKGLQKLKSKTAREDKKGAYGTMLNAAIKHAKDASSMAVFGMSCLTKGYTTLAREAKYVCVRALQGEGVDEKKEQPASESYFDPFAGVEIL